MISFPKIPMTKTTNFPLTQKVEREFIAICSSYGTRKTTIKEFTEEKFRGFMLYDCKLGSVNISSRWNDWVKIYRTKIERAPIDELFTFLMSPDVREFSYDDNCFLILEGIVENGFILK